MVKWLAIGAAASLFWANAASAQPKGLMAGEIVVHSSHAHDLRMSPLPPSAIPHRFISGMLVSHDVADNATLGIGLASIGRRKGGADFRIGTDNGRSRRPAVTFLLHF